MIEPGAQVGDIGERALIQHLRARIPTGDGVEVGVGDDAAAVEIGPRVLMTTDALVEDVHFRREWTPPRLLGRKALTVNLSDIAAMAGTARFATVSLFLPSTLPVAYVDGLYDGLLERAAETGVSVVGGNISRTDGPLTVDITLLGSSGSLLRRSGAEAGDLLVVTGTLGAAAEGRLLLAQGARLGDDGELRSTGMWTESSGSAVLHCLRAQLDPTPPLSFARMLAEHDVAHAGLDISDGFAGDVMRLCEESGVGAWVNPQSLPIDPMVVSFERARGGDARQLALSGGEDYQLLLAVPPERLDALRDLAVVWDLPVTVVGECLGGRPQLALRLPGGTVVPCPVDAYDHFRKDAVR